MTDRDVAMLAQRAQIQASGISATRLHIALPIYVEMRRQMAEGLDIDPDDMPRVCAAVATQAVAEADGLMRALGLIA